jgi:isoquinoline 1-oxidoreductase subunit alpha
MITLNINGKTQRYEGDPDMPLLWVLRAELNLKGTKFGCGMGLCGACTVHLNGESTRSCVGQIMTACALLAKNPHPTDAEVDSAMKGNLCRCGTYIRIRAAVHRAADSLKSQSSNG